MKFDESYQGCRRTCQYHRCSDTVLQYMRYIRYIYFYTKFLGAMVCLISLLNSILLYSRTKFYYFLSICAKNTNTQPETGYDAYYTTCEKLNFLSRSCFEAAEEST